jgi:uncharacterized protein YqgV (UPF0045/DUF77 family)
MFSLPSDKSEACGTAPDLWPALCSAEIHSEPASPFYQGRPRQYHIYALALPQGSPAIDKIFDAGYHKNTTDFDSPEGMEEKMKKLEASLAIQVLPQQLGGDEVLRIVDKVIAHIKSTGLETFVGPFETTIEGDFDRLMELAKECQLICIREGASNLLAYMKMAYSPAAGVWSIEEKTGKYHKKT